MTKFDWHSDTISRDTVVSDACKSTQNVRRLMIAHCDEQFKFDRSFMIWIRNGTAKTMGDAVDE